MADQLITRLWCRLTGYLTTGKVPRGEFLIATFGRELVDRNSNTVANGDTMAQNGLTPAFNAPPNVAGGLLVLGATPAGVVSNLTAIPAIATISLQTGTVLPIISGGSFFIYQLGFGNAGVYIPNDYDPVLNNRSWYGVSLSGAGGSTAQELGVGDGTVLGVGDGSVLGAP
jgi:hypothetical protein